MGKQDSKYNKNDFKKELKLLLISLQEQTSLQDSSFSIVTKFDIVAFVINLL